MTPAKPELPLCVDLDNTLVHTNTLVETIVGALRKNPAWVFLIPLWALRGQAYLWSRLVVAFQPSASTLPYAEPVVELVKREAATGRPLVLTTGAHEIVARSVASHLGQFTTVLATNGSVHLVGSAKAAALQSRYGQNGFDYVGDSREDMAVFRICRKAYVASASPALARELQRANIAATFLYPDGSPRRWSGFLAAIRPKQWVKNVLVFVPLLLGHRFADPQGLINTIATCALLCLASSAVYLLNDIFDVEVDRQHHSKRRRPFASGRLPIEWGGVAAIVLASLSVGLGWLVSPSVSIGLASYLAGTMLYSLWLKKLLIVDMILLASFYVFRVYLGSVATGIRISSWTALFCLFIFSGLAALKRYSELHNRVQQTTSSPNRRAYLLEDAMPLLSIGTSSFAGATVALGLYLGSPEVRGLYRTPDLLWLLCPILLGWTGRLWILGHRGELGDEDPVAFALRDRWSHVALLVAGLFFLLAL